VQCEKCWYAPYRATVHLPVGYSISVWPIGQVANATNVTSISRASERDRDGRLWPEAEMTPVSRRGGLLGYCGYAPVLAASTRVPCPPASAIEATSSMAGRKARRLKVTQAV
jgi:hypothetical protein